MSFGAEIPTYLVEQDRMLGYMNLLIPGNFGAYCFSHDGAVLRFQEIGQ